MENELTFEKAKSQIKWKTFINNLTSILIIFGVAMLIVLPIFFDETMDGHDILYHFDAIRSLNQAWQNGTFSSKIYSLICQDYGYGTGLFYSMLPASICVVFMNVLNLSCSSALGLEFFILFFVSGVIVYLFSKRLFKKNFVATICAVFYTAFPYFIADLYVRFAFGEIFLMLAVPLAVWGVYELVKNGNYKLFIPLFTLGIVLAIFVHTTMAVFLAIFLFIYLCFNFKTVISNYRWVPLLISCGLILLIAFISYFPMLYNYGISQASGLAWGAGFTYYTSFYNIMRLYLVWVTALMLLVLVVYSILFFNRPKVMWKSELKTYILLIIPLVANSCFFPWFLLNFMPFNSIQFCWRLWMISSISLVYMLGYILTHLKSKNYLKIFLCVVFCLIAMAGVFDYFIVDKNVVVVNESISIDSGLSFNEGMGGGKNGDYYPTGAENSYVFYRANDSMVLDTNVSVSELANYQSINRLSFMVSSSSSGYVVLNIPYNNCGNISITQNAGNGTSTAIDISSYLTYQEIGGVNYLKINFIDSSSELKIIIAYEDGGDLDSYLIENPFEFVVLSGDATFTNFVRSGADYTVEISTSETTTLELPTLYYKGYTLTYTTANGSYSIDATQGENGFIEIVVSESGTLSVEYKSFYMSFSTIVSIIGAVLFALVLLAVLLVPRKIYTRLGDWVTNMFKKYKILGEIVRFVIVGGIATLVDMFTMGVVMYFMQPEIYESFLNVFINTPIPSTLATIIGTTVGFLVGLVVNYILSILFVFNEKGNSRTAKGFLIFVGLSTIGLLINIVGTYIGFNLLGLNQWLVKIIMILIVLVYNYISKRLVLFKKKPEKDDKNDTKAGR